MLFSLIIGTFLLLAATICFQYRKDGLHPDVVFPSVWGMTMLLIGLAEPFGYFQISPGASLLFILGVFFFIAGALFGKRSSLSEGQISTYNLDFRKIAWFCIALHAVMLPLSWVEVSRITSNANDVFIAAYRLRADLVSGEERLGVIVGNYLLVGLFFVPVLTIGCMQNKIKMRMLVILAVPWILLNLLVGGRSSLITLIFSSIYVYISMNGRVSIKAVVSFSVFFIAVLVAGNLLVGKISADVEDGFWLILQQSAKGFFDYLLQGPILFSEYFNYPNKINPTWDALIFPCHVLEKINLCVLPPLHQEYLNFSRDGDLGNVYSLFFSIYPKYGWLGIILISSAYGWWARFHHARRRRSIFHLLMGSFLFSAVLLSVFSDTFGTSVYFFLKILIISLVASFAFEKT